MAILPTDIQILFTNYDVIAYFLNLASCSEHFINIKHRILATFNINQKKINLSGCMPLIKLKRIRVITKLPNSEQSSKVKVKTHKYINRQNQSTTGKL